MKQNGEINRLGKGRGRESVREAGKVKIFQTLIVLNYLKSVRNVIIMDLSLIFSNCLCFCFLVDIFSLCTYQLFGYSAHSSCSISEAAP